MRKAYTTDLTDAEWEIIKGFMPAPKHLGRKIEYSRREILNAIFYLNRNGCAWRDLPGDFPPYGTVSYYTVQGDKVRFFLLEDEEEKKFERDRRARDVPADVHGSRNQGVGLPAIQPPSSTCASGRWKRCS